MASSFHSIGTMSSALRAFQRELDVTGHNLANVNTPGYTRQVADLTAVDPTNFTQGRLLTLGNGVSVTSVNRIRDMFLEARRNEIGSDLGRAQSQSQGLGRIESLILDPGNPGIGDALGKFFDSWSALSANPNQTANRSEVLSSAQTLASRIKGTHEQLESLKTEQLGSAGETIGRINELASNLSQLNEEIRKIVGAGGEPNDLLDRRDMAIRELSSLADVRAQTLADGTVSVAVGSRGLVTGSDVQPLPTEPIDPVTGTIGTGDQKVEIRSGRLHGQFDAINAATSAQQRLDRLADALRTGVNDAYAKGVNANGVTGKAFFAAGTGAMSLDVDAGLKGQPELLATGLSGEAGDGELAQTISRMRNTGSPSLGGRTFIADFSDIVAQVGIDSRNSSESVRVQSALSQQVDNQVQSISGVSMDEEMANMLRFQRSYQAAAKALSTFDSVFDDLLGMLR